MQSRWSRVSRGVGAGAAATLVAATSHAAAGGRMPGFAGMALALCFCVLVAIALSGRRMPMAGISASVVLGQLAFHVVFSSFGGAAELTGGMHHSPVSVSGADAMAHASEEMWLAHGVAALLTILAIRFGEAAGSSLGESARMAMLPLLRRSHAVVLPFDRAPLPAVDLRLVPRIVLESHTAAGTRGPPAVLRSA